MDRSISLLCTPEGQVIEPALGGFSFVYMETTLTTKQIVEAATNDPALSEKSFEFGGKTFKIVYLRYKDNIQFLARLAPLLESIAAKLGNMSGVGGGITPATIMKYAAEDLPVMVALICKQTDSTVTSEWVEDHARSPFQLAKIVILQMQHNDTIADITDFFGQMLPLMKTGMAIAKQMKTSGTTR